MKQVEEVKLSGIVINPYNPRTISKEKLNKLIDSLLVFPKMLEMRPVVVDASLCVLGGNMRTDALNRIAKMSNKAICDHLSLLSDYQKMTDGEHPTMKLVTLIGRLIRNSSKEKWTILDSFGGSGTTMIACEQLNRKCRMMELSEHYCDVIIARWEKLTGKEAVKIDG